MLYPTINELTKGEYNRYELALATAKCARLITNEYVRQREAAERSMTGNKETDRPLISMIDSEYRDEKAVKTAVGRLRSGTYEIVRLTPEELAEEEAREEEAEKTAPVFGEIPDQLPDENDSDEEDVESADDIADPALADPALADPALADTATADTALEDAVLAEDSADGETVEGEEAAEEPSDPVAEPEKDETV